MVRHVFFSFHYERDHWRANQVRNSWVTQDRDVAGYVDTAEWESLKRQSNSAIESWIDDQLDGTSVSVVLIGAETYDRDWIDYEIEESAKRGNGILGVLIHNLKDKEGHTDSRGKNPLSKWHYTDPREEFTDVWETYDWNLHDGRENFGDWVEEAKQIANRR
jgi:hypothetical protein